MQRVTKDKCIDIINRYEPSKDGRKKGQLGIDGEWVGEGVSRSYIRSLSNAMQ